MHQRLVQSRVKYKDRWNNMHYVIKSFIPSFSKNWAKNKLQIIKLSKFMKNFLLGLMAGVCAAMLCVLVAHKMGKCDVPFAPSADETVIEEEVPQPSSLLDKMYTLPQLNELLVDHQELVSQMQCINTFEKLNTESVQAIASILLKANERITIYDIVNEYTKNKTIYDNTVNITPTDTLASTCTTPIEPDTTATRSMRDPNPVAAKTATIALKQLSAYNAII